MIESLLELKPGEIYGYLQSEDIIYNLNKIILLEEIIIVI